MRNVGYRRALPRLGAMQPVGVMESLVKSLCQRPTLLDCSGGVRAGGGYRLGG
jgi:hypothetical protein